MTLKPTLLGALSAALLMATPALSHASLEVAEATIGTTYKGVMRITHGCDGLATHTVKIEIPDGFYAVKPMPKAGWTVETVIGTYDTPYVNHGTEMTEGVREIIWSGGDLHDDWYDEFVFRGTIGADVAPGVMNFPTVQLCEGGENAWIDVDGTDKAHPAPKLTIVAGMAIDEHAGHMMASDFTLGDLTISAPFARATLPNAPVAGGFMTITNSGLEDDTLISVASEAAGVMQVHEMQMQGDAMKMRELESGLLIAAGQTVALKPGGFHIMFMDLKHALVQGETVMVTLTFAKAGSIEVPLTIGARDAKTAGGN
ncbi:MAG: copper chaperone PCu(A)C [Deltaproteobacteria bacterium]